MGVTSSRPGDRVTPDTRSSPDSAAGVSPSAAHAPATASYHAAVDEARGLDDELEALASEYMQAAQSSSTTCQDAHVGVIDQALQREPATRRNTIAYGDGRSSDDPSCAPPISWQRGQMLGAGSFGRVYFGLNSTTGELMAVKQIKYTPGQPTDATRHAALALQREVRCLQVLIHPNIVRYLGVERDDVNGIISICLEYCAGGSIASLLDRFGLFNEALTRSYMRMILAGLTFLHTRPGG